MLCDACSEATGCVVDVILLAQTLLETRNSKLEITVGTLLWRGAHLCRHEGGKVSELSMYIYKSFQILSPNTESWIGSH
jgi:hypothetical protein